MRLRIHQFKVDKLTSFFAGVIVGFVLGLIAWFMRFCVDQRSRNLDFLVELTRRLSLIPHAERLEIARTFARHGLIPSVLPSPAFDQFLCLMCTGVSDGEAGRKMCEHCGHFHGGAE